MTTFTRTWLQIVSQVLGLSLGMQGIVQRIKNTEKEGQHIESIHRKQTNQLVHLCYSSKRDDLSCHHPAMKSLPGWIPFTCWDHAGWDASGWNLASRQKEKKSGLHIFFSGQVLSQWCDCPAFSVLDIRIYVQFCVFILSFFYKKEKN